MVFVVVTSPVLGIKPSTGQFVCVCVCVCVCVFQLKVHKNKNAQQITCKVFMREKLHVNVFFWNNVKIWVYLHQ